MSNDGLRIVLDLRGKLFWFTLNWGGRNTNRLGDIRQPTRRSITQNFISDCCARLSGANAIKPGPPPISNKSLLSRFPFPSMALALHS
jgi:hypothetical protein